MQTNMRDYSTLRFDTNQSKGTALLLLLYTYYQYFICNNIYPLFYRCGDILLSVNEHSLHNVTHSKAVELLKMADGAVTLTVVSWPGTIV
jgi:hypothetical protein